MNYNSLLCLGIWGVFLSMLVIPLRSGSGLLTLTGDAQALLLPSWRFSLAKWRFIVLNPLHTFSPSLQVSVFAPASNEDIAATLLRIRMCYQQFSWLRDGLAVLTLLLLVLLPWNVLRHGGNALLAMALIAYLGYAGLWVCWYWRRDQAARALVRRHWALVWEPILCLPLAPHVLRKLFAAENAPLALVDVLAVNIALGMTCLQGLRARLCEMRETMDDEALRSHLQRLIDKVESRIVQKELSP